MFDFSTFSHEKGYTGYQYKETLSDRFRVFVNGKEAPVYTCRVSKHPFNRIWPGYQRPVEQSELSSFVNIVSDEKLEIKVMVLKDIGRIEIKPLSKKINYLVCGKEVSFTLNKNGQFVLVNGNCHNCLTIFNGKPVSGNNSATYYFGKGVYFTGKITLKDNESVYIDKDALVFGCLFARNAKNIRVYGNGIFDNGMEERICRSGYEGISNGNLRFYDCENVSVEGVGFRNSDQWCVNFFHCKNVIVDGISVFGQWKYNTDGIDIVNSEYVTIKNSFIRSFDDGIVLKGIKTYQDFNCANVTVENCVVWCDWGRALEIGLETECYVMENVKFINCDVIRTGAVVIDLQNGDFAEIRNILFEDIRVEYNTYDEPEIYQETDEMRYDLTVPFELSRLVYICNPRRSEMSAYSEMVDQKTDGKARVTKRGCIHDIEFKNLKVYFDERINLPDEQKKVLAEVTSTISGVRHYNLKISDLYLNGKKISSSETEIKGNCGTELKII